MTEINSLTAFKLHTRTIMISLKEMDLVGEDVESDCTLASRYLVAKLTPRDPANREANHIVLPCRKGKANQDYL